MAQVAERGGAKSVTIVFASVGLGEFFVIGYTERVEFKIRKHGSPVAFGTARFHERQHSFLVHFRKCRRIAACVLVEAGIGGDERPLKRRQRLADLCRCDGFGAECSSKLLLVLRDGPQPRHNRVEGHFPLVGVSAHFFERFQGFERLRFEAFAA